MFSYLYVPWITVRSVIIFNLLFMQMGAGILHCVVVTLGCHLSQSLHSSYSRGK